MTPRKLRLISSLTVFSVATHKLLQNSFLGPPSIRLRTFSGNRTHPLHEWFLSKVNIAIVCMKLWNPNAYVVLPPRIGNSYILSATAESSEIVDPIRVFSITTSIGNFVRVHIEYISDEYLWCISAAAGASLCQSRRAL